MNEEITATQTLNLSDLMIGHKWHNRRFRWKGWMQWPIAVVIVFSIYYFITTSAGKTVDPRAFAVSFACVIALSLFAARIDQYLAKRRLRRYLKEKPSGHKAISWNFQEKGAACSSEGAYSLTEWERVSESVSCPDGILIYWEKAVFHWLSKAAFASESDYDRFLQLIAAKTKHSKIG
ncbi:MAG: YcxB family protein [Prosthecobacter sp.]|nr:YcxB family protein [Prosthecobacter sp.]